MGAQLVFNVLQARKLRVVEQPMFLQVVCSALSAVTVSSQHFQVVDVRRAVMDLRLEIQRVLE